jgi:sarcosine oxidase subunit beta
MKRHSIFSILRNAMTHQDGWERTWRSPEFRPEYDVIIIGGGGRGLTTAH